MKVILKAEKGELFMQYEDDGGDLYIPSNIRKRHEIVDGIGTPEVKIIVTSSIIGLVIGIFIYIFQHQMFTLLLPPAMGFLFSYVFARKDRYNQSTMDKLQLLKKFQNEQKRYCYKYRSIYEKDVRNGKTKRRVDSESSQ